MVTDLELSRAHAMKENAALVVHAERLEAQLEDLRHKLTWARHDVADEVFDHALSELGLGHAGATHFHRALRAALVIVKGAV